MRKFKSPSSSLLALAFACLLLPATPTLAESTEGAKAIVRGALDQVLGILSNSALSEDERFAKVREIAYENFDFATMSKLVLGRNWRGFDDAQRSEFVSEFRDLLARTYGERLSRYGDVKVALTGERTHKRGDVTIDTEITGGQFSGVQINYRMRPGQGTWKVIDVKIEGVGLVSSYRSQFRDALSNSSPDKLLEKMRQKNLQAPKAATVASPARS